MTIDLLARNWALVIASVLWTAVLLFVAFRIFQDSPRGRLWATVRQLRRREATARNARRVVAKSAAKLTRLRANAAAKKPRHLEEAAGSLEDARALQKICDDQVLVARNHVRKLILEEYPPKRHAAMRERYLGQESPDTAPFRLDG
ncbi:MAG: hypothetical protein OEM60_02885 [Gammaproteobacteria bacterium]|nr:hypothetical protein [Gammaproteobacteria bacterium]MDH3430085.1 hypothetical protein [Gammaproteobacteria bacterium]MDH3432784.1 hypothetical protein [Gammaproteobacteria bacterium]